MAQLRAKVSSAREYNNTRVHKPATAFGQKFLSLANQVATERGLRVFPKAAAILSKVEHGPTNNDCALKWFLDEHKCSPYLHVNTDGVLEFCCHKAPEYNIWKERFDRLHYPIFKRPLNNFRNGEHLTNDDLHNFYIASCMTLSELQTSENELGLIQPHNKITKENRISHDCSAKCRIEEYYNYLKAEFSHLLEKTRKMYRDIVNSNNNNAFNYYKEKNNVDILYPVPNNPGYWKSQYINQRYDKCFDGSNLHNLLYSMPTNLYSCSTADPNSVLLIHDGLKLVQAPKLIRVIDKLKIYEHKAVVTLINGVPGCGKTREIINRATSSDLVVTQCRETKSEINVRLQGKRKHNVKCRTVDSFLLNFDKTDNYRYKNIFIDEGLMIHPGILDILAIITKCETIEVFGDNNQLNFISRVPHFNIRHEAYPFSLESIRNISLRCPKDVCKLLSQFYSQGMRSDTNLRDNTIETRQINGFADIPIGPDYKYLTFSQFEKTQLIENGFLNTNTVHEVQGRVYETVVLVRSICRNSKLYNSLHHGVVAISRHTNCFIYCTAADKDPSTDCIFYLLNQ